MTVEMTRWTLREPPCSLERRRKTLLFRSPGGCGTFYRATRFVAESSLNAVRLDDYKFILKQQPGGWIGDTVTPGAPPIVNLRLDPFERSLFHDGNLGSLEYMEWYKYQFWRFVQVQDAVRVLAESAIAYPPMQKGSSFTMEAVAAQIRAHMQKQASQ